MRIIISPAKQMKTDTDNFVCTQLPVFLDKAEILMEWIRSLSYEEQKKLWGCSDKIARQNAERFAHMDLRKNLTPALLAYEGIQYTYMAPAVFEDGEFDYVQEHLRILSGFYGVVRPFDGVVPYRLEMQAKAAVAGSRNLYEFWGDSIYRQLVGSYGESDESIAPEKDQENEPGQNKASQDEACQEDFCQDDSCRTQGHVLINLASKEYAKCIEKYLQPEDRYISCVFGELDGDKVVQKGVYAKMARGEMVRYMAGIHAEEPEEMKGFHWSGYQYDPNRSSETSYVFIRTGIPGKGHE